MLAEELLRSELMRVFGSSRVYRGGRGIETLKFFRCDIRATPVQAKTEKGKAATDRECSSPFGQALDSRVERSVSIVAFVGPFDRLYPENPARDQRRNLCRVTATVRLFSTDGCANWHPHFIRGTVINERGGEVAQFVQYYESGTVEGVIQAKTVDNPCSEMCDSQTSANYPPHSTAWPEKSSEPYPVGQQPWPR